ncbi:ABC transporter ATP-binding protein [Tepidibacter hydrothermalis]
MRESKSVLLENIVKEYISQENKSVFTAVNNISLKIEAGDFVTLLGPSGCGKTTTLRMIAGFEEVTSGNIYLGNDNVNEVTPDKRDTTMVFQSYALFPHYTIYDNIAYGLKIKKMNKDEIKKKTEKILDLVGLNGMENRYPNQLSGGQQQRVALARALVMEPGVLLFDEPLSNLDAKLRVVMRNEIRRIQKTLGLTSVYVTHDQAEAMSLSDKIIIMNKGNIEQIGTPTEIYQQPASEFVADFIGVANFVDGVIDHIGKDFLDVTMLGQSIKLPLKGNKPRCEGDKIRLVIRPEAITIGHEGDYDGLVESSMFMGSVQDYTVRVDNEILKIEDSNPISKTVFNIGEKVKVSLKEESIHIL